MKRIPIFLEVGEKRTFAGALDWPGWCRSGRDQDSAIEALLEYAPRYKRVIAQSKLKFVAPQAITVFATKEQVQGNATTDFGAPGVMLDDDQRTFTVADQRRAEQSLQAIWQSFDAAVAQAAGKTLRKGPRGGGRDTQKIIEHLLGSDAGYLRQIAQQVRLDDSEPQAALAATRAAILDGLAAAARGEIPAKGPRGGSRWPAHYFVRRVAWHALDHTWEIEDRLA